MARTNEVVEEVMEGGKYSHQDILEVVESMIDDKFSNIFAAGDKKMLCLYIYVRYYSEVKHCCK